MKSLRYIINRDNFTPEIMTVKSSFLGGLCDFILNIVQYYDVVESVEPMRIAVREKEEQLANALEKKQKVDALVGDLNEKLGILVASFDKAMSEKQQAMDEAARCEKKLDLAQRLVNALGSEQERWK